jgi:hypothetical protein
MRGVWEQQLDVVGSRMARMVPTEGPRTWLVRLSGSEDEDVLGMLGCPGILDADPYRLIEVDIPGPNPGTPPPYTTIFDLETPEICARRRSQSTTPTRSGKTCICSALARGRSGRCLRKYETDCARPGHVLRWVVAAQSRRTAPPIWA